MPVPSENSVLMVSCGKGVGEDLGPGFSFGKGGALHLLHALQGLGQVPAFGKEQGKPGLKLVLKQCFQVVNVIHILIVFCKPSTASYSQYLFQLRSQVSAQITGGCGSSWACGGVGVGDSQGITRQEHHLPTPPLQISVLTSLRDTGQGLSSEGQQTQNVSWCPEKVRKIIDLKKKKRFFHTFTFYPYQKSLSLKVLALTPQVWFPKPANTSSLPVGAPRVRPTFFQTNNGTWYFAKHCGFSSFNSEGSGKYLYSQFPFLPLFFSFLISLIFFLSILAVEHPCYCPLE